MDRETRERKTRNDIRKRKEGRLKRSEEDANKSRKIICKKKQQQNLIEGLLYFRHCAEFLISIFSCDHPLPPPINPRDRR